MLFFEVLPFTTLAVSVNGETLKGACGDGAAMFGVSGPLYLKPCSEYDIPKLRTSRYSHNDSHVILN